MAVNVIQDRAPSISSLAEKAYAHLKSQNIMAQPHPALWLRMKILHMGTSAQHLQ